MNPGLFLHFTLTVGLPVGGLRSTRRPSPRDHIDPAIAF